MIGTISVKVAAHNPSFPLEPVYTFVNSSQSFRILNVPKKIGKWDITAVFVNVSYPDNTVVAKSCALNGSVWVGTVSGCATSGTTTNGFVVTASGVDEDGNTVSNYVLGAGDLYVQNLDGTIAPETNAAKMFFFATTPTSPKIGDTTFISGTMNIWNGTAWQPVAQTSDPSFIEDADGNKIEANGDFTHLDNNKWLVDMSSYGTYILDPDGIYKWTYAEAEGEEGNKKVTLEWLDYEENWKLTLYQWSNIYGYWYVLAYGTSHDSQQVTTLEIEISGDTQILCQLRRPAPATTKLATIEQIPTKTSDLVNDSGFITASAIPSSYSSISDSDNNVIFASRAVRYMGAGDPYWVVMYNGQNYNLSGDKTYSSYYPSDPHDGDLAFELGYSGYWWFQVMQWVETGGYWDYIAYYEDYNDGEDATELYYEYWDSESEQTITVKFAEWTTPQVLKNDELTLKSYVDANIQTLTSSISAGVSQAIASAQTYTDTKLSHTVLFSGTYSDSTTFSYSVYTV